jgi:proteasome lid subunit RPN8/RPN11
MRRLLLPAAERRAIAEHAGAAYPEECCGVLLGRELADGAGAAVVAVQAANNERSDSRHNRYVIPPQAVLAAHKQARARGLEVVGYYHSHPDHPAVPSDFDREHAWPGLSYLIVAVEIGRPAAARSWRLTDDRRRFVEERVEAGEAGEADDADDSVSPADVS